MDRSAWSLVAALLLGFVAVSVIVALLLTWLAGRRRERDTAAVKAQLGVHFAELANGALRDNSDMFLKLARESFAREQAGAHTILRERRLNN